MIAPGGKYTPAESPEKPGRRDGPPGGSPDCAIARERSPKGRSKKSGTESGRSSCSMTLTRGVPRGRRLSLIETKSWDPGASRADSESHESLEFECPPGGRARPEGQDRSMRPVLEIRDSLRGRRKTTLRWLLRAQPRRRTASSGARTPPAGQPVPRIRPTISGRHQLRLVVGNSPGIHPAQVIRAARTRCVFPGRVSLSRDMAGDRCGDRPFSTAPSPSERRSWRESIRVASLPSRSCSPPFRNWTWSPCRLPS
jgi:hypothetical protein